MRVSCWIISIGWNFTSRSKLSLTNSKELFNAWRAASRTSGLGVYWSMILIYKYMHDKKYLLLLFLSSSLNNSSQDFIRLALKNNRILRLSMCQHDHVPWSSWFLSFSNSTYCSFTHITDSLQCRNFESCIIWASHILKDHLNKIRPLTKR